MLMSVITVRLPDGLLHALDDSAQTLHLPRSEYIRKAIEAMNKEILDTKIKKKMAKASLRVRENSMRINREFGDIEDEL